MKKVDKIDKSDQMLNTVIYKTIPNQKISFTYFLLSKWSLISLIFIVFIYDFTYYNISIWFVFVFLILYQKTSLKRKDIFKNPIFQFYKFFLNKILY